LEKLNKLKIDLETKDCTFKPKIDEKSVKLSKRKMS
jgi:hypothetical protein